MHSLFIPVRLDIVWGVIKSSHRYHILGGWTFFITSSFIWIGVKQTLVQLQDSGCRTKPPPPNSHILDFLNFKMLLWLAVTYRKPEICDFTVVSWWRLTIFIIRYFNNCMVLEQHIHVCPSYQNWKIWLIPTSFH